MNNMAITCPQQEFTDRRRLSPADQRTMDELDSIVANVGEEDDPETASEPASDPDDRSAVSLEEELAGLEMEFAVQKVEPVSDIAPAPAPAHLEPDFFVEINRDPERFAEAVVGNVVDIKTGAPVPEAPVPGSASWAGSAGQKALMDILTTGKDKPRRREKRSQLLECFQEKQRERRRELYREKNPHARHNNRYGDDEVTKLASRKEQNRISQQKARDAKKAAKAATTTTAGGSDAPWTV